MIQKGNSYRFKAKKYNEHTRICAPNGISSGFLHLLCNFQSFFFEYFKAIGLILNYPRSGLFLMQSLTILVQRENPASILGTFVVGMTLGGLTDDIF